jgi:Xaa-Pro dipeptidase
MLLLALLLAQIPTPPNPQPPASLTPQAAQPPPAAAPAAEPAGLSAARLQQIQAALAREKLDGWLFFDFRGSDPIAYRMLGLDSSRGPHSRRWYCYVPARGQPQKLVHAIEPRSLDGVPGRTFTYAAWRVRDRELGAMLRGQQRVAMDYSPRNEIPTVARADAGTVGLESVLSPDELRSQARATDALAQILEATAQEAARRVREGKPATERELQEFAGQRMREQGFIDDHPGVQVDAHAADPHYGPAPTGSAIAGRNSVLLLDYSSRQGNGPHDIYGDLTKVYFLGERVPDEVARVATIVFAARDAAIALLRTRLELGRAPTGAEVDDAARAVIDKAGYGAQFLHRTGHSIDTHGHGDGVNNDNFETRDTRRHNDNTCFSIEPGIYLAAHFELALDDAGVHLAADAEAPGEIDPRLD